MGRIIILFFFLAGMAHAQSSEEWFTMGMSYFSQRDFLTADSCFLTAYRIDPSRFDALNGSGNARLKMGDTIGAFATFSTIINLNPHYALAFTNRGTISFARGNYSAAVNDFSSAVNADKSWLDPVTRRLRAASYLRLSSENDTFKDSALIDFDIALSLDPNNCEAHYNRAEILFDRNRFTAAINDCTAAIELDSGFVEAFLLRARVALAVHDSKRALRDCDLAEAIAPLETAPLFLRADILYSLKNYSAALEVYSEILQLSPENGKAFLQRGLLKVFLKVNACEDFGNALRFGELDAAALISTYCR